MIINSPTLDAVRDGFNSLFQEGLDMAPDDWRRIATEVNSTGSGEQYGGLGEVDNVREWVGDRQIKSMKEWDYFLKNLDWELTIGVPRNHILDDKLGQYSMRFKNMGKSTGAFPNQKCFGGLNLGFNELCYDGQNFFDTDHPVLDKDGNMTTIANTDGGSGRAWFLLDTTQVMMPILFQNRQSFNFISKDNQSDDNVYHRKEYLYGTDGRFAVGFGWWQYCWGSKQPLTPENYEIARVALSSVTGDYGRPTGGNGDLLVVQPADESAAKAIVASTLINGGETNSHAGTAEVFKSAWLI